MGMYWNAEYTVDWYLVCIGLYNIWRADTGSEVDCGL